MDDSRFDTLVRSLTTAGSRRRALRGLLTGALGLAGWPVGKDAAAHDPSKKCKKKSGEAKKKCLKKAKKHNAQHASEPPPPPPPNPCAGKADDTACNGDGKCLRGTCNPRPACLTYLSGCTFATAGDCCSAQCLAASGKCSSGNGTAYREGVPCQQQVDCALGLHCIGYRCIRVPCAAGKNYCADGTSFCGSGGACLPRSDGASLCGLDAGSSHYGCTSDAGCQQRTGNAGAFCVGCPIDSFCDCGFSGFCAVPR